MARILVTGGAGFIGSHLSEKLLSLGHEVLCLDNFFTGDKRNISAHFGNPNFEVIRHDVTLPILLEIDQIYHLACPASPVQYQVNPVKTIKTNVMGTINMLGLAKRVGARMLLASTSEVYGNPLEHPQTEEYWGNVNPIGVRSCYDEGKRVAETLVMDYHRSNNVDVRIIRIFNTYGPRMLFNDGRVVSNFVYQAIRGEPLTLYGDGSQTRSFCYVDDLVDGLMRMMEQTKTTGPINLGNPNEMSVKQLGELVTTLTGSKENFVFRDLPSDDPARRQPDISKAKEFLGWEPQTNIEVGLEATINDFRERMSHA